MRRSLLLTLHTLGPFSDGLHGSELEFRGGIYNARDTIETAPEMLLLSMKSGSSCKARRPTILRHSWVREIIPADASKNLAY